MGSEMCIRDSLDMVEVGNDGKRFLLIANSNRPLMKIDFKDLEAYQGSLTTKTAIKAGAEGVNYVSLPYVNVQQLDKYGDGNFVFIQRESNGNLALKTGNEYWVK